MRSLNLLENSHFWKRPVLTGRSFCAVPHPTLMRNLLAVIAVLIASAGTAPSQPLATVQHVDLKKYLGRWYEIAKYPNRFEKACASDETAAYALRKDGKLSVVNACRTSNGELKEAKGTAKVVDRETNAKLKVTFFWPFYGDYWILDLAPDYSYAIVGEPKRKYLWILSRTPELSPGVWEHLLARTRELGYDPEKLVKTSQSPQDYGAH